MTTDSAIDASVTEQAQQARERLDAHVRETVEWHFNESTGCPFWLEKKSELKFDPLKDVQGYDDLKKFPLFEAPKAHSLMETSEHIGKIVLQT